MKRVVVFAGTNEGRKLCEFLAGRGVQVTASVATEYGSLGMPDMPNLHVLEGRLSLDEIQDLIKDYDFVIDATHPYAKIVSVNIKSAVERTGRKYLRVIRPSLEYDNVMECADISEACRYLNGTSGNVLVTTGSKELLPYTAVEDYDKRLYVRVLPTAEAIQECSRLKFNGANIICMQGPFSENMNKSMLEQIDARFLVTKETGRSGGFAEKLSAARQLGVQVVLIGRPTREEGLDLQAACRFFVKELSLDETVHSHFPMFMDIGKKKIVVVGGGTIATRRIETLLKFGAEMTVIAPEFSKTLASLHDDNRIRIKFGKYESADIANAFVVLAATNDREVNEQVYQDAKSRGILVNVSDKKEQCDFFFPAIFTNEGLVGGVISREGTNHQNAKEKARLIGDFLRRGGDAGCDL